jgi:hypothetical protein
MTEYGQSIPTRIYREFTALSLTKNQFFDRLCRMLSTVGMLYCDATSYGTWGGAAVGSSVSAPYLHPLIDDSDLYTDTGDYTKRWAIFDYPTNETFMIDGRQYRPCVYVTTGQNNHGSVADYQTHRVGLFPAVRPAVGAWAPSDLLVALRMTVNTAVQHAGMIGDAATTDQRFTGGYNGATHWYQRAYVSLNTWRNFTSENNPTYPDTLFCNHWFAYLGPAGLVVSIGTADATNSQNKETFGNRIHAMFLFGGGRIPNRARTPSLDFNLPRIDPVLFLYNGPNVETNLPFNVANLGASTHTLAVGFDLRSSIGQGQAVYSRIGNLDNIDRPFPDLFNIMYPVPSPRVVNGNARHILSRLIYQPRTGVLTSALDSTFTPIDGDINRVTTDWIDMFATPSARLTDSTAPLGLYTDPDTGVQWFLTYWEPARAGIALQAQSPTILSTLTTRTYGVGMPYPVAIAGTLASGNNTTFTQIGTSPRVVAVHQQLSTDRNMRWSIPVGQNYLELVCTDINNQEPAVELWFEAPAGTTMQGTWQLQCDASLTGGVENNTNQVLELELYDELRGTWRSIWTIFPAGTNNANSSWNLSARPAASTKAKYDYNLATLALPVTNDARFTAGSVTKMPGMFIMRISFARNNTSGGTITARVGNFRLIFTPLV